MRGRSGWRTVSDTPGELVLRRARTADLPVLTALNQQLIDDQGHDNPAGPAQLEARMRRWLGGLYCVALIESAGAPVAHAVWREDDDGVHVRQFFVVRDHRGCGVGRQAFALLGGEWAADDVKLDVLLHNERALMFWRSLGFRDYSLTLRRPRRYESPSADAASTQH